MEPKQNTLLDFSDVDLRNIEFALKQFAENAEGDEFDEFFQATLEKVQAIINEADLNENN